MGEQERLPEAELDVMSRLWAAGPQTARQLREALADVRPMTHSSVCTLLGRLEQKGFVKREKAAVGKAFLYKPARARETTSREALGQLVNRLFGGQPMALVVSLLESHPPSPEQIDELEELLTQLRRQRTARRGKRGKS